MAGLQQVEEEEVEEARGGGGTEEEEKKCPPFEQCSDATLSQFCTAGRGRDAGGFLLRQLLLRRPLHGVWVNKTEPISCVDILDCVQ